MMKVTVLGGGHGCYAAAVEMVEKGHEVKLWRRNSEAFSAITEAGGIHIKDRHGERLVAVPTTGDLKEAIAGAELIVIPLPTTSHEDLAAHTAPLFTDGQVVFPASGHLWQLYLCPSHVRCR